MSNEEVEHRTKFSEIPKDGQWYELPDSQFIRWNIKLDMWDWMIVRDGEALDSGQLPDGTELFGVEE